MTASAPTDLMLLRRWVAARVRLNARNPRVLVFAFAFPLVLLVLFNGLNGNTRVAAMGAAGGKVDFAQFYTPSIGVFALTAACYSSVILAISTARDNGLLKRILGTPLPMWIYMSSWLVGAALVGVTSVVLMFVVAVPLFGVHIYASQLPAAAVSLVLGAATLSALGLAVASLVRNAEQAMPVAQLTFLPISFISGIWYPLDGAPGWVVTIAHAFPLFHIVNAFDGAFVANAPHAGWSGDDLWAIAVWGAVALLVATRRFRRELGTGEAAGLPRLRGVRSEVGGL